MKFLAVKINHVGVLSSFGFWLKRLNQLCSILATWDAQHCSTKLYAAVYTNLFTVNNYYIRTCHILLVGWIVSHSGWVRMGSNHGPRSYNKFFALNVGRKGIEPLTSFLSGTRSTTEPPTHLCKNLICRNFVASSNTRSTI